MLLANMTKTIIKHESFVDPVLWTIWSADADCPVSLLQVRSNRRFGSLSRRKICKLRHLFAGSIS